MPANVSARVSNDREHIAVTTEEPLLVEDRGHVRILTLNRPEARNAVNMALTLALGQAIEDADTDRSVWVVILTGAGEQSFCAGADLKALSRGESVTPEEPALAAWDFAGYVAHHISKPTIAAVNGTALGGGTELALASDLVVAVEEASFGLPEVSRGLYASAGGAFRLPTQLPKKVAMEMLLTGRPISAQRALELGLVNRVVPRASLLESALELAQLICANAPLAVQATKRVANGIVDGVIEAETPRWEQCAREVADLIQTADMREGVLAFTERRPPVWTAS